MNSVESAGQAPIDQLALRGSQTRSGLVVKAEAQRSWSPFAPSSRPDISPPSGTSPPPAGGGCPLFQRGGPEREGGKTSRKSSLINLESPPWFCGAGSGFVSASVLRAFTLQLGGSHGRLRCCSAGSPAAPAPVPGRTSPHPRPRRPPTARGRPSAPLSVHPLYPLAQEGLRGS